MTGTTRPDAGFTLVEVLIALAIAGLIVSAMAGLTERSGAALAKARAVRHDVEAAAELGERFRIMVENVQDTGDFSRVSFAADRLRLPVWASAAGPTAAPTEAEIRVDGSTDAPVVLSVPGGLGTATRHAGLRIAFSYYYRRTPREAPTWHRGWDRPDRLPLAISLRISARDLPRAIDVVAIPRGARPLGCLLAPAETACRGPAP